MDRSGPRWALKNPERGRFLAFWAVKYVRKRVKKRRKSDLLVTFGLNVRQLDDQQEVWERFGVDDGVFRLVNKVEEGVDGAENELEALKKKEMLISFLFWFTSQIFMQL